MKIAAGIVLYNPEIARLDKNIESIKTQVNEIILFNNGSKNTKQILKYLKNKNVNYILVNSDSNLGIAHALNRLCKEAMKKNYKWLLTLDQDTVVSPNLVHKYSQYVNLPNVGQLSCTYKDRNSSELKYKIDTDVKEVKECITSGTLLSLGALEKVGGFDENMFIDYVDFDLCYALRKINYKTYQISYIGMLHEIGHITPVNFFCKRIDIFNQTTFRHYYRCRNYFLFSKRYNLCKVHTMIYMQFKEWVKVLLYENNKFAKTKAMFKGMYDGLRISTDRKNYF